MFQLLKNHEDPTEQVEWVASYESSHIIETAVKWHKKGEFNFELLDQGQRIGWCDAEGNIGFETNMGSELNPARFMAYYVNLD